MTTLPQLASKRVIYIGGLADEATVDLVRAAMIPFGGIKTIDVPMDYTVGKHRGFAFVEYEDAEDAEEAIFNLDGSELMGRTLRVSLAQPNQANKLSKKEDAIWTSDEWFQQQVGNDKESQAKERSREQDVKTLQDR